MVFLNDPNWIAGTYYIINLISALNHAEEAKKPVVCLICRKSTDFNLVKKETRYVYLKKYIYHYNIIQRIINKVSKLVSGKKLIDLRPRMKDFDIYFPANDNADDIFSFIHRKIYWITDFQERYYPDFFSEEEVEERIKVNGLIACKQSDIIFSSEDAKNDFLKFYPGALASAYVLNFAVTHPDISQIDFETLKVKYKLPEKYFFSPNQFWLHKNQLIVLKTIKLLKNKGINVWVVFSGKEYDYRNPGYFRLFKKVCN